MPSDRSLISGKRITFQFIRQLRSQPNRPNPLVLVDPRGLFGVLGTLQYSVLYSNSRPQSPPPPSKPPPAFSLGTISQRPRRCLFSRENRCRSSPRFRTGAYPPFPYLWNCSSDCLVLHRGRLTKAPGDSERTRGTHEEPHKRNAPRIAKCRRQNRSSYPRSYAPVEHSSRPLSWRQNFSRIDATPTELG